MFTVNRKEVLYLQEWILETINQFGYLGVFLLIAVENVFPPIPSEVILTFSGFMTTHSELRVWGVIITATLGSLLGALILYGVGRILSPERLERWLDGWVGKLLRFKKGDILSACKWFEKHGNGAVFFCRCVPIVRSLISIPAGMANMRMGLFLLLTTAGSLVWNTILVWLGVVAGASWELIVGYIGAYSTITLLVLAGAGLAVAAWYFKKRYFKKQ